MQLLKRQITLGSVRAISSVWAIPECPTREERVCLVLAHGAGNDMDHPFLSFVHTAVAEAGILTVRFNFPYTESGRRLPDRPTVLEDTWKAVIQAVRGDALLAPQHLFLGGKSLGGRIASVLAAQGLPCDGLVFLGYPLHPAGQPDRLRTDHWPAIRCPMLFVQGTRDPLCAPDRLRRELTKLQVPVALHEIIDGDHSFQLPKASTRPRDAVWDEIVRTICDWVSSTVSADIPDIPPEPMARSTPSAPRAMPDREPSSAG